MSSFSMSKLTKALPSVSRQSQPRISSLSITRPFSHQRTCFARNDGSDIEKQMLNREPESPSGSSSPLSAITQMMQGKRSGAPSSRESLRRPSSPHHLHVYCHKHNTILTLTRPNGSPLLSIGCGQIGFRKAGRSGFDPAYQLSAHVMNQIQEKGFLMEIERLEVVYRGFGKGRDAFTKVLLGHEGRHLRGLVARVTDSTRLKFGGTRSRHVRRLG
ncbi:unnamed protein product [Penicillium nalgiovense]|nr:unnamed protein product [Penicillium nalgiovense]